MIGQTLTKIYVSILSMKLFFGHKAQGQTSFRRGFSTLYDIPYPHPQSYCAGGLSAQEMNLCWTSAKFLTQILDLDYAAFI